MQHDLYRKIRSHRGQPEPELSLRWRGLEDRRNRLIRYVPWWVVGAAALAILAVTFTALLCQPGSPRRSGARRAGEGGPGRVLAAPCRDRPFAGPTLKQLLRADEAAGALSVEEKGGRTLITLLGGDLFGSGSATVNPAYDQTLQRVAQAMNKVPGRVLVVGHTDDQPIRSLRYQDNFELSRERAVSVGEDPAAYDRQPRQADLDRRRLVRAALPPGIRIPRTGRAIGGWKSSTCEERERCFHFLSASVLIVARLSAGRGVHLERRAVLRLRRLSSPRVCNRAADRHRGGRRRAGSPYALFKRLRAYRSERQAVGGGRRPAAGRAGPALRRSREAARTVRGGRGDAQAATAQRPQSVRPAVVRDYRRSRFRQDDGAPQFGLEVPAGAAGGKGGACAASAARAIATGGSPTKRCFSIPRVAIPPRTPTRPPTARRGESSWRCLRKYRARRPVNGVILTINAQDLMVQGDTAREAHVEAARRRLNELNRELRIQLPVYLMVTKCDLVAGFTEYFDDLAQEGRAQVWGVTFPYEQTLESEATQVFPAEFDALMARLNERVFARVEEVRDPRRRTRVFAFPQQMAALRDALAQFVSEVFASTHFDQQILLRGVYFTSGTQDGTPVDRLLGAIGRRFGVAPDAVAPASGPGKAYFVERLLKDVMIGESGLAGVNRRLEARKAAAQLGAYAAMALIAVCGVLALSVSYSRNRAYLAQAAADIAAAATGAAGPGGGLARSGCCPASMRYAPSSIRPIGIGATPRGRCVGDSIRAGRSAIPRATRTCASSTACCCRGWRRGSRHVSSSTRSDPEKLYVYLKAYLMLGEPQASRQEAPAGRWPISSGRPDGAGERRRDCAVDAFSEPARTMATPCGRSRWIGRSSRRRAAAFVRRRWRRSCTTRSSATTPTIVRARCASTCSAGVGVEQVFRRKSGVSLSEPLPSLYGRAVFQEITGAGQGRAASNSLPRTAGCGARNSCPPQIPRRLAAGRQRTSTNWTTSAPGTRLLNDLEFVSFSTVPQMSEALRILTGPTSPLRGLLRVVVDNTALDRSAQGRRSPVRSRHAKKKLTLGSRAS